jgi:hypothetical protein
MVARVRTQCASGSSGAAPNVRIQDIVQKSPDYWHDHHKHYSLGVGQLIVKN